MMFPTLFAGARIRGVGLEEKNPRIPGPGEIIKASQGFAFHSTWQFTLALKRHFRVSDLCHGGGVGESSPRQPLCPAGSLQSEQGWWVSSEADHCSLGCRPSEGRWGLSATRLGVLAAATSERNFCMIYKVFGSIFNKKGKQHVRHSVL